MPRTYGLQILIIQRVRDCKSRTTTKFAPNNTAIFKSSNEKTFNFTNFMNFMNLINFTNLINFHT